ncbi:MAG: chitobiase/beta-hexosaminidase C-terminal domain-containing protein, partial [Candidatus Cloacimonetes bacterium]|nr:chitobiase/beta-hexosaminidase C-terminal domain-containing protein [Candidatus Cloacimonadota bacterium]
MKKLLILMVVLLNSILLGGQALDVRTLSEADFGPEYKAYLKQQQSLAKDGLSFNLVEIPFNLPAAGDPTFMQGNTWVKDFATYINGYTFGDPLFMYWSQSERFLIEAVEGFPTKLSFTPLEAVWHGSETISITISDIELGPGAMGQSTWLFNVSVSNQLDAPVFSFPNLATEIPNGYIFSTPEDTPITIDFVTNMPGTELPYIYSVDNLENPSAIQLFVTPTSASVGFSQLNSGAGLGTEVTFYPPENVVGDYQDYTFGLTARDRVYDVISERTIVLRVTQVNDPPEILEVKVDTVPVDDVMGPFDQGSSHQLEAVATDMDGDSIFYRWILEGENGSVELGTNGSLDYLFNDPGFFTLTLYVRDREDGSGFEVSRAWDITVSPVGPQFMPLGSEGPFSAALDVEISAPGVEDATIYYSIGGDTGPWTEYSGPVNIPLHTNPPEAYEQVIWAYFVLPGGLESVHQFQTYQMTGTVQTPIFSHASGRYLPNNPDSSIGSDFLLSLSTIPADAEIQYSLDDGSNWLPYAAPGIQIPTQSRVNLLAKAGKTGWLDSPESTVHSYVINDQVVFDAPTMITDPAPAPDGSYCVCFGDSVQVDFSALTSVPAAANIYYSVEPLGLPGEAVVYSYDPATGDPFTLYVTDSSTIRWWAEFSDPALPGEVAQYYPSATHSFDFDVKNRTVMLNWDDISNPTVFDPIPQSLPQYYDAPINIAINTEVSPDTGIAAEIWYQYKFDNMPDFGDWALYTDPLAADRDVSIRAYAKAMPPYTTMDSEIHEADYTITGTLPLPMISHTSPPEDPYSSPFAPIGGSHTFSENLKVSLQMPEGDRWQDAAILYSLDDGLSYVLYTAPITLSAGHYKFSAYAAKPNWNDSVVSNTAEYFVKFLPPVTFSSNDGPLSIPDPSLSLSEHYQQIEVSLFSEDGASIRYEWGEGVVPDATSSSPSYSAPIVMGAATLTEPKEYTLKVIATKAGWVNSEQISWTFRLVPTMPDPVFSPEDSNHPSAINVSIAVLPAPEGTFEVWYLEDPSGSDIPGPGNGILYAGQFEVDSSRIIAARAYKDGFRPSSVVYKAYNIANTIGDIVFNPVAGTYTAVQNVSLSVLPAEANLFYSFDNVTWTPYTTAIPLGLGTQSTIYAKAELAGSETKTGQASYTVLAEPEILPLQSQYATGASIDISITAPVGDLYYILNGADPVLGVSPVILNGITESTEIEAWVENGGIQTEHIVRTYTFNAQLSAPVANYVSGTYYDALSVVLSQPQNADIYYSTDNVTFTAYSEVISINQNQSLYAFATKENHPQSETREWTYTLKVRNPQASLASGEYAGSREVALSVNTAGASILYNNVSADLPPESWSVYAGNPISVDENTEFWLKGVKDNWLSSDTVYLNYIINGAVQDVSFSPVAATYYDTQMVELSSVPPDAEIRYSVDGSSPSLIYSGPLAVDQNTRIRARAYKSNWLPSAESSAQYFLKVSGLSDGGVTTIHYDEFQVELSTGTADTEIYYTLSTGIPDILYTGPITISGSSTLRAVAKRNNWLDSEMYQRSFVINQRVATPSISPAGGLFNYSPVEVELTCLTADADILYRTSVTGAWQAYLNLLSITETTLIQAKATKEGWVDSEISTVQFIIEMPVTPQVATPAFSPLPGTFNVPQSVTLTSATPDADIYYTLDGSDPDPASATLYTGAIAVDNSLTIKAIAVKAGWDNSEIASAEYVIAPLQVLDPIVFPDSGTYNAPFNVVIINPTVGATTLYQMNLETETWTVYDPANPINIMESSSLRVKSVKDLMIDSAVIERNYVLTGTVSLAALSLDPAPGTYPTLQSVFYTGAPDPADAVIRFTTNGVDPTEADPIFDSALNPPLDSSLNLKLRAFKEDWLPSAVITGNYLFTGQVALPADMFSPAAGTYTSAQTVYLNTNTSPAGARLRY